MAKISNMYLYAIGTQILKIKYSIICDLLNENLLIYTLKFGIFIYFNGYITLQKIRIGMCYRDCVNPHLIRL